MMRHVIDETKILIVYVMILLLFLFSLGQKVNALKGEINSTVAAQCATHESAAIIGKYNDQLHAQIDNAEQSLTIALRLGYQARARSESSLIARLRADLITLPTQDCSKPFLK